jgi:hypothetical protein
MVQDGQKVRTHLQNNQTKRAAVVAQAVECLPSKREALSPNLSIT